MKSPFTEAERLILSSQFRALAKLTGEQGYERDAKIIESGFVSLHEELLRPLEAEVSTEETSVVAEILQMYEDIYNATKGKPPQALTFSGFCDPPEGTELYFASFVTEELGRYAILGEVLCAPSPMLPKYLRMLVCYKQRADIFGLSEQDLQRLTTVANLVIDDTDNHFVN